MNKSQLEKSLGGLSKTDKMPCSSWSLSAFFCNVGGKLSTIKESVCDGCYAQKGFYNMYKKDHTTRHHNKMTIYKDNPTTWENNFILYFNEKYTKTTKNDNGYFRWFDSGDLQSYEMLLSIVKIAENSPKIKFWLPTKEYSLIRQYRKENGNFPSNLVVRVSAPMMDAKINGFENTSSVMKTSDLSKGDKLCNSYQNDGKCLDCRLCWDKSVKNITYKYH